MSALETRFSTALITLLRGPLWREEDQHLWAWLLAHQSRVRDYVGVLSLELMVDETEGFAFVRQGKDEESEEELPRLIPRRQLPYHVSLLLALLRRRLVEFDAHATDTRLVLGKDDLVDMMRDFFREATNDVKLVAKITAAIEKVVSMKFLRRLKGSPDKYEVSRIIKAFVDAQWLEAFDAKLATYRDHAAAGESEEEA